MIVSIDDFQARFTRPLKPAETTRAESLLEEAEAIIRAEFARFGRNFDEELQVEWVQVAARQVVLELVSAAILTGDSAGKRQYSITAGGITESSTWADVSTSAWGVLSLTDEHRRKLGLPIVVLPKARFPRPKRYPERW